MRNIVILDLDGVLITTPSWKADEVHEDGYSSFNEIAVHNLNTLLKNMSNAELWLSSSRRRTKTLDEFRLIFLNRGINFKLKGYLPGAERHNVSRYEEIRAFLSHERMKNYLILDDDSSLENLLPEQKRNWVKTKPLLGFDGEKLDEALKILEQWS